MFRVWLPLFLLSFGAFVHANNAQPNVLFITVDDLNTDLGAYGHPLVKTPNIDRLAKQGVLFKQAYSQVPKCTPSRSSFMTGLYPEQTGIVAHGSHTRTTAHFRDHIPNVVTLPQMFKQQGYTTARVGKIYHQGVPNQIGTSGADDALSWDITRNPTGVDNRPDVIDRVETFNQKAFAKKAYGGTLSFLSLDSADKDHTDGKVATETIQLLQQLEPQKTGKPFFLATGFYRPHTPFVAPKQYFDLYPLERIKPYKMPKNDRFDIPTIALPDRADQRSLKPQQRKRIIQAYYAAISFVDAQIGRVLDALSQQELAGNTIVVLLSDHGYELGQHDLWQKGSLFEGSAKAPLIIHAPMVSGNGSVITSPVELLDIYPTLAGLTKLSPPEYLAGVDLTPSLQNPDNIVKDFAFTMIRNRYRGPNNEFAFKLIHGKSIKTTRYRYTEWGEGLYGAELYDHQNDPEELKNLAHNPNFESSRMTLKRLLDDVSSKASQRVHSIE